MTTLIDCISTATGFTTADWINTVSAVSALLTAIVTFVTVQEIKKQREHSYHPDINIANFDFYVYRYDKDEEDEEENYLSLYYSTERMGELEVKKGFNELSIDINNIGLAAAKIVSWSWYIDFVGLQNVLKSKESFIDFTFEKDEISISSQKLDIQWFYDVNDENTSGFFNFILPYSIENRKNKIAIPSSFLDLYWLYKAKEILEDNHNSEKEYPPLQLHLTYTNMHGKEIEKTFLLYLAWNFMSNPLREQTELAKFRFEIIEMNTTDSYND